MGRRKGAAYAQRPTLTELFTSLAHTAALRLPPQLSSSGLAHFLMSYWHAPFPHSVVGMGAREQAAVCTLRAEGFPTEVALEGLLPSVSSKVHVKVGLLREGVVAELAHVGALVPTGERKAIPQHPLPKLSWVSCKGGGSTGARRAPRTHLCFALMCICKPLRLDALWPHSSQTNSFSPRCLNASWRRKSVRDRKHLEQAEHCSRQAGGLR